MRILIAFFLVIAPVASAAQILVDAGRGPVTVEVPSSYDPAKPLPLVVGLHGYTNTGADFENYFQLAPFAESEGFFYANPTGTTDLFGNPFWNGTNACCNLFGSGVNDVAYLLALIDEIRSQLNVDPWRIHFTGYSNGAFMSFRMSCDHADLVASMAGQSGVSYLNPLDCQPSGPLHTLQIHGTSDETISYTGGTVPLGGSYPAAEQTVADWAGYNGCDATPNTSLASLDLDSGIVGAESTRIEYLEECSPGGSSRLWTVPGGAHRISQSSVYKQRLVQFLLQHRKAGLFFSDKTTLQWPTLYGAADYRVYRGNLSDLFDTDADGLAENGYGDCQTSTVASSYVDATIPTAGSGFFYLIGFQDGAGVDSMLGTVSSGGARLPATSCP